MGNEDLLFKSIHLYFVRHLFLETLFRTVVLLSTGKFVMCRGKNPWAMGSDIWDVMNYTQCYGCAINVRYMDRS